MCGSFHRGRVTTGPERDRRGGPLRTGHEGGPSLFRFVLPSDSKRPERAAYQAERDAGCAMVWSTVRQPAIGSVLPGGGLVAAHLHLARTVCRRAERAVVRAAKSEVVRPEALRYLNRLSDALFVMSRHVARLYGEAEPRWEPERT